MRGPATFCQPDKCSGKRDQLFLSICNMAPVRSPLLLPASSLSTATTSVSLTLPLPDQPASTVGRKREDGQDSRQAGITGQDVQNLTVKSSLLAATMEDPSAYLILVSTASTGGGGLFSSRHTFFHREHGRYCFRKVYSENITHKLPYTPNKKLSTPTKKPSTPTKITSRQTKRFSMINKTLIMPRKKQVRQQNIKYANQNTKYANQKFMLFCREVIFVANLRTFLAYFLQAKKYGGVPKRTNIRYAPPQH